MSSKKTGERENPRSVRGAFFSEYVRMIRRRKDVDWARVLVPEDLRYLNERIASETWYPMATFERFGIAILEHMGGVTHHTVRVWGRLSAAQFAAREPRIVAAGDPIESLMRLRVMRNSLFDFPAFDIPHMGVGHAEVTIMYYMSPPAEEAACHQTAGFCEEVVSMTGATSVDGKFERRSWEGDETTSFLLRWS
jgi:hypothetical protein